ncbi:uncharacterized protein LOC130520133 isoform X1 [Takifugu flavidus]|uniref:uncharacterized protein LOC130520133 isoform X1 n=3 Tax=Takifugu flavidus TaxID=433684 RepID=UPI0025441E21|nr:uncharacterized protein LOC130520133 isoform X1 [Takifugu flavidus]
MSYVYVGLFLPHFTKAAAEKAKRPGKQSRPASAHKSVRRTAPSSTARSPSEPHIEVPVAAPERTTAVMDAAPQPCRPTATSAAQPEVTYEGWHKMWESAPNGLPQADVAWLKEDETNGLFQRPASFQDKYGKMKWRKVLKDDRMWFHPPEVPGVVGRTVPSADSFFRSRVFFWRPVGVWRYSLRCPRAACPARENKGAFLYRCGYSHTVRQICHVSGWYSMLTEVLACNACRKAAKDSEEHAIGRFPSWEGCILNQLSPAHQGMFPAVLTLRRGVDKQVVRLLRDRTEGNTMAKVWRQVQESHCEEYLQRKDLYTTLLTQYTKPGKITKSFSPKFQLPPPRRELPSPRLLRKAFLLAEAENIEDYRAQIMSTFGKVLKYDSTKKICKKLSGDGKGTAEWCTNVGNERSQILMSVLTCEESLEKMRPMAKGLMERYQRAGEAAPELMYVDRGCCRALGVSSLEQLFDKWVDRGMLIRLDIFHWIHRFDAAVRTDHHSKCALFKSALSAAVFSYNKDDVALLLQAVRAGLPDMADSLSDSQLIERHVTKRDLSHYVRRITVGAQETFVRVQKVIDTLKGPAGMDDNQVHLFKGNDDIDHVWQNQQKHLECIQDPPGRNMYTIKKHVTRNGVSLPRYATDRGSNSLEGFHSFLPSMIPGPHCAAVPFQVYLLAGIARWNADRESASVRGQRGRQHLVYVSPLVHRLNERCQQLFGVVEDANYRAPVPPGGERIGLEYLFCQSTDTFNVPEHYAQTTNTLQTDEDEGDEGEVDEASRDDDPPDGDAGYISDAVDDRLTPLPRNLHLTDQAVADDFDPCAEDVCGPNHLPGYEHVEELSRLLVDVALEEGKLAISNSTRQRVIAAWNGLHLHDRSIHQFDSLYSARWGNALFGRTNGDPAESSLVQKLKFSKRHSAAHLLDSRKNRLMYCFVKQLWLHPHCRAKAGGLPHKHLLTRLYQRVQQRVTVDDAELSKLGIPLLKINTKSIAHFIRRQEALSAANVTDHGLSVLRRHQSIAQCSQPPALELPLERPHTSRPQVTYEVTPSLAGTRKLKYRHGRTDAAPYLPPLGHTVTSPSPPAPQPEPPSPAPSQTTPRKGTFVPQPVPLCSSGQIQATLPTVPLAVSKHKPSQSPRHQWSPARSTFYKRRWVEHSGTEPTAFKVHICALCGQPTKGHNKYRKKTYCPNSKKSSSPGLEGQTFDTFVDFQRAVDILLGPHFQV